MWRCTALTLKMLKLTCKDRSRVTNVSLLILFGCLEAIKNCVLKTVLAVLQLRICSDIYCINSEPLKYYSKIN